MTPQPKTWQEKIINCFGGEKWNASVILMEFPEVLDNLESLLQDAVEAERERLESLIPEKKDTTKGRYASSFGLGFNKAVEIMQEAVKGK